MSQENLQQQGVISEDEKRRILQEQEDVENKLRRSYGARRNAQLAALKQRMADRRKKRMNELTTKHEQEKMDVSVRSLTLSTGICGWSIEMSLYD